jgi:hypothetical protein
VDCFIESKILRFGRWIALVTTVEIVHRHKRRHVMNPSSPAFASVLCPIDFSDCSKHALAAASWLAEVSAKPLYLLHAVHLDMPHYLSEETKAKVLEHW